MKKKYMILSGILLIGYLYIVAKITLWGIQRIQFSGIGLLLIGYIGIIFLQILSGIVFRNTNGKTAELTLMIANCLLCIPILPLILLIGIPAVGYSILSGRLIREYPIEEKKAA